MTDIAEVNTTTADEQSGGRKRKGSGLDSMVLPELKQLASSLGLRGTGGMRKGQLIDAIRGAQNGSSAPATERAHRQSEEHSERLVGSGNGAQDASAAPALPIVDTTADTTGERLRQVESTRPVEAPVRSGGRRRPYGD